MVFPGTGGSWSNRAVFYLCSGRTEYSHIVLLLSVGLSILPKCLGRELVNVPNSCFIDHFGELASYTLTDGWVINSPLRYPHSFYLL